LVFAKHPRCGEGETGIREEDVLINLVEVPKENGSFGNGEAQYATLILVTSAPQRLRGENLPG
jgi:hypothetical protein